jgi:threonine 3-dehydrogenase
MKALVKSKPEHGLWLEDMPEPAIGINDVLIRVRHTGICGTMCTFTNGTSERRRQSPRPWQSGMSL